MISSATPSPISSAGGEQVSLVGTFPATNVRVYLGPIGTSDDLPCTGLGGGYDVASEDGTTLTVIAPPAEKGTNYISIVGGLGSDVLAVTVVERSWSAKVHAMRRLLPRWYAVGARSLDLEEKL